MNRQSFPVRVKQGERGAVATLIAVLMAGGVVMGMLALTVDVGGIMYERRQLQNGADSSSLALASACGADVADCDPARPEVQSLLGANASDGVSQYDKRTYGDGACGRATGSASLPACTSSSTDASMSNLRQCPPLPNWLKGTGATIPYVETYSRTQTTGGSTILPKYFSQLLVGGGGDSDVSACARAAWGPVASYTATIPFVFSACEWQAFMTSYGGYVADGPVGAKPGYGGPGQPAWPTLDREKVIFVYNSDKATDCIYNGKDTAGGFGFVQSTDCSATVSSDGWVQIDVGKSPTVDCKNKIPSFYQTVISVPVFNCMVRPKASDPAPTGGIAGKDCTADGTGGAKTYYHIEGWAKLYLSGYRVTSDSGPSYVRGGVPCNNPDNCFSGWFVKGQLDSDAIVPPGSGGADFGTYGVLPAG